MPPDDAPTLADQISTLLRASMQAHAAYRQHAPRMQASNGKAIKTLGDPVAAKANLRRALQLRQQAHDLDPDHTAPAWRDEQRLTPSQQDTHTALMAYYDTRLTRLGPG